MNNETGAIIDEDVLDFLDQFLTHKRREIADALNSLVYHRRSELSIPHLEDEEDIAALSHADLSKLHSLAAPDHQSELSFSNVQLLGLILNELKVIDYSLPTYSSPMVNERKFATSGVICVSGFTPKAALFSAVCDWIDGLTNLDLSGAGTDQPSDIDGQYVCLDEHNQVRYGALYENCDGGRVFRETRVGADATYWYTKVDHSEELPITLLHNWVLVMPTTSPNVEVPIDLSTVTDTQRIFMFLTNLSPHVKDETVVHLDGVLDQPLHTIESIGRLTEKDWQQFAGWCADDTKMTKGKKSWAEHTAWECFVLVMEGMSFNFTTRQYDAQFEYGANDDNNEGN